MSDKRGNRITSNVTRGASPGTPVTLRMEWWENERWPEPGDYLITQAGSAYLVDDIRPAREGSTSTVFTARCIKTTMDEAVEAMRLETPPKLFEIEWAKRRKRERRPA